METLHFTEQHGTALGAEKNLNSNLQNQRQAHAQFLKNLKGGGAKCSSPCGMQPSGCEFCPSATEKPITNATYACFHLPFYTESKDFRKTGCSNNCNTCEAANYPWK